MTYGRVLVWVKEKVVHVSPPQAGHDWLVLLVGVHDLKGVRTTLRPLGAPTTVVLDGAKISLRIPSTSGLTGLACRAILQTESSRCGPRGVTECLAQNEY